MELKYKYSCIISVGESWFLLWGKAKYSSMFSENKTQLFLQREEFKICVEKQTKKKRKSLQQLNTKCLGVKLCSFLSDTSLKLWKDPCHFLRHAIFLFHALISHNKKLFFSTGYSAYLPGFLTCTPFLSNYLCILRTL